MIAEILYLLSDIDAMVQCHSKAHSTFSSLDQMKAELKTIKMRGKKRDIWVKDIPVTGFSLDHATTSHRHAQSDCRGSRAHDFGACSIPASP